MIPPTADLTLRRSIEARTIIAYARAYGKIPAWLLRSLIELDRQIQRQARLSQVREVRGAIRIPVV